MDKICKTKLYVKVCDEIIQFCREELKSLLGLKRLRFGKLSIEESLTLAILYQLSGTKHKKAFYHYINRKDFPNLPSYDKFNLHLNQLHKLVEKILSNNLVKFQHNIGYLDSTKLETTKPYYYGKIYNKESELLPKARKGFSSTGEFKGFKLHVLINQAKSLCNIKLTSANVNDLNPIKEGFLDDCVGKIYADSGYVSRDIYYKCMDKNILLIAKPRQSMMENNQYGFGYLPDWEKNFAKPYKGRISIERLFSNLKHNFGLILNKMHSQKGFLMNLFSCLLAYQWKNLNLI